MSLWFYLPKKIISIHGAEDSARDIFFSSTLGPSKIFKYFF